MNIGMLVFPGITATDYIAPGDLFARMPGAKLKLLWKHTDPIETELGWPFQATQTLAECEAARATDGPLDMLVVPGGPGIIELLEDEEVLGFLARQGATATWVVGICAGPLVLGAAGLFKGYEATCHWASHELLDLVGATPVKQRVVVDRNRVTGAGITSGIDCALRAIALATTDDTARGIQLFAEYDPQPPFDSGSPEKAPAHIVQAMRERVKGVIAQRRAILSARQ